MAKGLRGGKYSARRKARIGDGEGGTPAKLGRGDKFFTITLTSGTNITITARNLEDARNKIGYKHYKNLRKGRK